MRRHGRTAVTSWALLAALGASAQAVERLTTPDRSDAVAALRVETAELKARVDALKAQRDDARRLIDLKTARLQAMEKARAER